MPCLRARICIRLLASMCAPARSARWRGPHNLAATRSTAHNLRSHPGFRPAWHPTAPMPSRRRAGLVSLRTAPDLAAARHQHSIVPNLTAHPIMTRLCHAEAAYARLQGCIMNQNPATAPAVLWTCCSHQLMVYDSLRSIPLAIQELYARCQVGNTGIESNTIEQDHVSS